MKRSATPSPEEYTLIQAWSSTSASVNLSRAYSFDSPGEYKVQLKTALKYLDDKLNIRDVLPNTRDVLSSVLIH